MTRRPGSALPPQPAIAHPGGDGRTVIVHERFTELGGSERVVEQLAALAPGGRVFVPVCDDRVAGVLDLGLPVSSSVLQRLYRGDGAYAHLLPLLPLAFAHADLDDADLVVTSHHAFANRVRPPRHVPVVSYTHSPARWMWDPSMRRGETGGVLGGAALGAFAAAQRRADRAAAERVHTVVANSRAVAERVQRWWGRDAVVVAPPVDTAYYTPDPAVMREDFFLLAGRLVPYKRPDLAAAAAARAGVRLVVAGEGRARAATEAAAAPGTEFVGKVSDEELRDLFRRCRALLFPGEEDFGIVPVEAQACGAPVVALDAGGARDSVVHGVTGLLVAHPGTSAGAFVDHFALTLSTFAAQTFDSAVIRAHAEGFSRASFRDRLGAVLAAVSAGAAPADVVAGTRRRIAA